MKIFVKRFFKKAISEISPISNFYLLNKNVKPDILAGIIVAIIALPLALAFGEVSGLGPKAGIISAAVGGIFGGLFGGCVVGVSGPTMPMASQVAVFGAVIGASGNHDLGAAFSIIFLSGIGLIFFSVLQISRFIYFVPYPAIAGFMCGISAIVIIGQIYPFLGIVGYQSNNPLWVLSNLAIIVKNTNLNVLAVSISSIVIIVSWKKIASRILFLKSVPSPLPTLIIGSIIAHYIGLKNLNQNLFIPSVHADSFSFFIPDLSRFSQFIGPAIGLASLALIDSLLSCRVADTMTGTRHNSNRETFGQGIANIISGVLGGLSTATATTQTVGNITFGAKTPLATIVKGLMMLLVLFSIGNFVSYIPISCLSAILFKLGIDILDYRILPILKNLSFTDFLIFISVFLTTIFADIIIAVGVGVLISFFRYYKEVYFTIAYGKNFKWFSTKSSKLNLDIFKNKNFDLASSYILKPKGSLYFGSVQTLIKSYLSIPKHSILFIDMSDVLNIDLTGAFGLEDLIAFANKNKSQIYIFNVNNKVKRSLNKLKFEQNIRHEVILD